MSGDIQIYRNGYRNPQSAQREFGEVSERKVVRRLYGGDWSLSFSIRAQDRRQSLRLGDAFKDWPGLNCSDVVSGWHGRIVQIDLTYGFVKIRWSLISGYVNRIYVVYNSGNSVASTSGTTGDIARFSEYGEIVNANSVTDPSEAADIAAAALLDYDQANPRPISVNRSYAENAEIDVVALGYLPLSARTVNNQSNVGLDFSALSDTYVHTAISALAGNCPELQQGTVEPSNIDYVSADNLSGKNTWSLLEELARIRGSNGERYYIRSDREGRVHYGLFPSAGDSFKLKHRITEQGITRFGQSKVLEPYECFPGWYTDTLTGAEMLIEEVSFGDSNRVLPVMRGLSSDETYSGIK